MKIYNFILIIFLSYVVVSCDTSATKSDKVNVAYADSLQNVAVMKDSIINDMLGSFNAIRNNLKQIQSSEMAIQLEVNREGDIEDARDAINNDVGRINLLIQKNDQLIEELNKRLSSSQIEIKEFKRLIAELNEEVENKNKEIQRLNRLLDEKEFMLVELSSKVDSLNIKSKNQEKEIRAIIDEANKAYFTYGTFKELRDKNVITKEGGFLGIGKSKTLKEDFNKEYFTEVDMREQTSFLIYADKAKLVTHHPSGSYEFVGEKGVDSLIILNPDSFWDASRYMVVLIE